VNEDASTQREIGGCDKVFIGEPYEVDCEASTALGLKVEHLDLIKDAKVSFED
jgi:hypothetical protein